MLLLPLWARRAPSRGAGVRRRRRNDAASPARGLACRDGWVAAGAAATHGPSTRPELRAQKYRGRCELPWQRGGPGRSRAQAARRAGKRRAARCGGFGTGTSPRLGTEASREPLEAASSWSRRTKRLFLAEERKNVESVPGKSRRRQDSPTDSPNPPALPSSRKPAPEEAAFLILFINSYLYHRTPRAGGRSSPWQRRHSHNFSSRATESAPEPFARPHVERQGLARAAC